jgi:hypothetical protein
MTSQPDHADKVAKSLQELEARAHVDLDATFVHETSRLVPKRQEDKTKINLYPLKHPTQNSNLNIFLTQANTIIYILSTKNSIKSVKVSIFIILNNLS